MGCAAIFVLLCAMSLVLLRLYRHVMEWNDTRRSIILDQLHHDMVALREAVETVRSTESTNGLLAQPPRGTSSLGRSSALERWTTRRPPRESRFCRRQESWPVCRTADSCSERQPCEAERPAEEAESSAENPAQVVMTWLEQTENQVGPHDVLRAPRLIDARAPHGEASQLGGANHGDRAAHEPRAKTPMPLPLFVPFLCARSL